MTNIGHNGHLKQFVSRVENVEQEQRALDADKKEIYAEAKATGFEVKILKKVIAERRRDPGARAEEDAMMDLYRKALGMIPDDEPLTRAPAREAEPAAPPSQPTPAPGGADGNGGDVTPSEAAPPAPDLEIPAFMDRRPK